MSIVWPLCLYVPTSYFMVALYVVLFGPFTEKDRKRIKLLFVAAPIGFPVVFAWMIWEFFKLAWEEIDDKRCPESDLDRRVEMDYDKRR